MCIYIESIYIYIYIYIYTCLYMYIYLVSIYIFQEHTHTHILDIFGLWSPPITISYTFMCTYYVTVKLIFCLSTFFNPLVTVWGDAGGCPTTRHLPQWPRWSLAPPQSWGSWESRSSIPYSSPWSMELMDRESGYKFGNIIN